MEVEELHTSEYIVSLFFVRLDELVLASSLYTTSKTRTMTQYDTT